MGSIFLIFLGLWIVYQAFRNKDNAFLDLDGSKNIDWKEALYLGIALSVDAFGIGIGSSIIGYRSFLFPILVAIFQLMFLSIGKLIGIKICSSSNIPENVWSILSGILLICISVSRFFV